MPKKPDVLVVGAGLAGLAVARELGKTHRVVVLEQGPRPGAEASAQNAGMVRRLGEDPHERALAIRSHALLEAPTGALQQNDVSQVTGAVIALATDPHHLHDAAAHLRASGVRIQPMDRPGEVAPMLTNSRLAACWYLPDERIADAQAMVSAFVQDIVRQGGEIRCDTPVTGLIQQGDRVRGVVSSKGRLEAQWTVLAAGAWSSQLAQPLGLWRPLFPLRRPVLVLESTTQEPIRHPWVWIDDEGIYARPAGTHWLVSGCEEMHDIPPPRPGSTQEPTSRHRELARTKLTKFFPKLSDRSFTGGWSGLRTFAPDRAPLLGPDPDISGLAWAAGLGGFGVTCCLGVGEAVATLLRGQNVSWLHHSGVAPNRSFLRRWPIRPSGDIHRVKLIGGMPPRSP